MSMPTCRHCGHRFDTTAQLDDHTGYVIQFAPILCAPAEGDDE